MWNSFISAFTGDRMGELLSQMEGIDKNNVQQVTRLAEEYGDVLESVSKAVHSPVIDVLFAFGDQNACQSIASQADTSQALVLQLAATTSTSEPQVSDINTRQPLKPSKNTRPLPPSLKELQKTKYAAVKNYSRFPTPENKEIMQAMNRVTKQRIAEFLRTGNTSTNMDMHDRLKVSSKREVPEHPDQHQSQSTDEYTDDEDSDSAGALEIELLKTPQVKNSQLTAGADNRRLPTATEHYSQSSYEDDSQSPHLSQHTGNARSIDYFSNFRAADITDEVRRRRFEEYKDISDWAHSTLIPVNARQFPPLAEGTSQFLSSIENTSQVLPPVANTRRYLPPTENTSHQVRPPVGHADQSLPVAENARQLIRSAENTRQSQPQIKDTRPLPPALKELQKRKFTAQKDYSRFPSPENKKILKDLERELKSGIAEFRRIGNQQNSTNEWDRLVELLSKIKTTDVNDEYQLNHVIEEYKDVIEPMARVIRERFYPAVPVVEDAQSSLPSTSGDSQPAPSDTSVLTPELKELHKRKFAALKEYSRYPSPDNKRILKELEREVKRGMAEFRRMGNRTQL